MNNVIKIVVALLCLPLLALGLGAMFNPMGMLDKFAVEPQGIHGLNTIRGDIGGLLLCNVIMMVMGVWRNNTTWFLAVAVIMCTVAFGRLIGFVMDGIETAVAPALVVELVIAGVMLFAHQRLASENSN
jgi:hypothetical protein